MTQVDFRLLGSPNTAANGIQQGFAMGRQMAADRRERQQAEELQSALATLHTNPDDEEASRVLFQRDPELAMRFQAQRSERQFNADLGTYLAGTYGGGQRNALAGMGAPPQSAPNALAAFVQPQAAPQDALPPAAAGTGFDEAFAPLSPGAARQPQNVGGVPSNVPSGSPFSQPAPQPAAATPAQQPAMAEQPQGEPQAMDTSFLGQPQNARDRAFLAMLQRDPVRAMEIDSTMREGFIERVRQERELYTLSIEELSRAQDEASWQAARQRLAPMAQALGADLSQVPANYPGPDAVRSMLENALPVKERLDFFLDQTNVQEDNTRADRNTDSLIGTRDRRAAEYERANRSREGISRRGQDLTDSRVRSRSGGSGRRASGGTSTERVTVRAGEPTARTREGQTLVVRNGDWVVAD